MAPSEKSFCSDGEAFIATQATVVVDAFCCDHSLAKRERAMIKWQASHRRIFAVAASPWLSAAASGI